MSVRGVMFGPDPENRGMQGLLWATLRERTHGRAFFPATHKKTPVKPVFYMARLARFELTTLAFGGQYSIQLSYKRTK